MAGTSQIKFINKMIKTLTETGEVITSLKSSKHILHLTVAPQIIEKEVENKTVEVDLIDLLLREDLTQLPEKYKQKVINKEPFEIEVIIKQIIKYS